MVRFECKRARQGREKDGGKEHKAVQTLQWPYTYRFSSVKMI